MGSFGAFAFVTGGGGSRTDRVLEKALVDPGVVAPSAEEDETDEVDEQGSTDRGG